MNTSDLIIRDNISICDAMRIIDKSDYKILFVTKDGKLYGTLTDGDIRRYLFNGGSLQGVAAEAANNTPKVACSLSQAAELYNRLYYIAIPIVDSNGIILDIYFGEESPKIKKKIQVPVVINAGGKGTRLDPFTRVLPKPLIPVGELPIIEHIMQRFKEYGCHDFSMIVNYKKELIKTYFKECDNQYSISWYDEDMPLGTGGGLSLLKGKMKETFFFTSCDTLLMADYESMLRFHRENGNAVTMICAWKNLTLPYGIVEMGNGGIIEEMREKPELSFLTNTSIYIVEPSVIEDIPVETSITFPEIIQMQINKGRKAAAYPVSESEWLDMGQISELEKMRERLYGR
jgi:dTDP-glucose pyrophosphorylase